MGPSLRRRSAQREGSPLSKTAKAQKAEPNAVKYDEIVTKWGLIFDKSV